MTHGEFCLNRPVDGQLRFIKLCSAMTVLIECYDRNMFYVKLIGCSPACRDVQGMTFEFGVLGRAFVDL